jgi:hypothetical protein
MYELLLTMYYKILDRIVFHHNIPYGYMYVNQKSLFGVFLVDPLLFISCFLLSLDVG